MSRQIVAWWTKEGLLCLQCGILGIDPESWAVGECAIWTYKDCLTSGDTHEDYDCGDICTQCEKVLVPKP